MSQKTAAPAAAPSAKAAKAPKAAKPTAAGGRNSLARLGPLPWIGPCIALILLVVVWPVVEMVLTSTHKISGLGIDFGFNGIGRYQKLFSDPRLGTVMLWTLVWTVLVVGFTMVISLALAQLYNQNFPGRKYTRWALIIPWAASVIVTSIGFRWMLDEVAGVLNRLMLDLHLIHSAQNWTGDAAHSKPWLILVAVFVSLPFTTYTLLAGLQTVPGEVYEAARVDGATTWQTYLKITLPLLRPSFLVALVINLINVFNSFPVIWGMTQGGPNTDTSTSTVFMFILGQTDVGESAAMSVVNFAVVIAMVLLFLKVSRWNEES
ncbi:carbohydrate ABC transporter permease [Streptacidiphilus rugosus]|uniref:carbohydrate ABC transporter permease n=1 Tax=Streptacidiphilus rugosus TaxID=405783 RepID=UPI000564A901|nr:sugar ABC transporter permease [Streptacidiphilus rugosus]